MSKVDEELTRRLHGAERPVDVDAVFEGLERRRSHRERVRRAQAALLAFAVLAATVGGFSILTRLFDPDRVGMVATTPFGATGAIVVCGDETGGQICRIDAGALARGATSEDFVQLTHFTDGFAVRSPSVSPDGTTVVFERHEPGANTTRSNSAALWTIRTDGTALRQRTFCCLTDPSWSPTGALVAVSSDGESADSPPSALAIIDWSADPDHEVRMVNLPGLVFPSSPQWLLDGKRILFAARSGSTTDLYTMAIDGSDLTNITNSAETEYTPRLSPDGRSIAFWMGSPSGVEIRICPIDCSTTRPLSDREGRPIYGAFPVWSPDGAWIAFQVDTGKTTEYRVARIDGSEERALADSVGAVAWIPVVEANSPQPSSVPEASVSPHPSPEGRDIGLGFNLCDTHRLRGIDFLGDGAAGTAWTGTKIRADGTCPKAYDDPYGVAVDITGDGLADLWSGESIEYCGGCEPLKGFDVNGDGREELLVVLQYFSIMQYGIYTVVDADGGPQLVPFRVGAPGHPAHGFDAGKPFSFWVGGDAGLSDWFYCEGLPTFWLTSTESPIDPGPDDVKTVHVTKVSLEADGIAHVLYADTYTVPAQDQLHLAHTSPDHSDPDCGMGVRPG